VGFATKPQIALALIEQALADGGAPAPVLADAAYGNGFAFRERLRQRQLEFFLQVTPKNTWAGPKRCPPSSTVNIAPSSRPSTYRRRVICWTSRVLAAEAWKACSWKAAGGKRRRTRLAWQEVYLARRLKEPPGQLEKLWLVVDWPEGASEPYHCYLAHLHRVPSKARCLTLSRSRWHVEHYLQRSKDYLGFNHYEGRWHGFHRHAALVMLAYGFLTLERLRLQQEQQQQQQQQQEADGSVTAVPARRKKRRSNREEGSGLRLTLPAVRRALQRFSLPACHLDCPYGRALAHR
jgi:SRSO17 transposase